MKYSKATNYALHTMVYLGAAQTGKTIGVRPLAEFQGVSPTYLSKILTKLVKSGLVESTPGVNGGYKLAISKLDISFLDVIHAIEGPASLFHCDFRHDQKQDDVCMIQEVMSDAEQRMEQYLRERKIAELVEKADEHMLAFVLAESK